MSNKKKLTPAEERLVEKATKLPGEGALNVAVTIFEKLDHPGDPHAHLSDRELAEEIVARAESAIAGTAETVSREDVHARAEAHLKT